MRGRRDHLTDKQRADLRKDIQSGFAIPYLMRVYDISERVAYTHRAKVLGLSQVEPVHNIKLPKIRHPSELEDGTDVLSAAKSNGVEPVKKSHPKPNALPWCTPALLMAGKARPARRREEAA